MNNIKRIDFNNVNILAHSDNWRKLLIKEILLIGCKIKNYRYTLIKIRSIYIYRVFQKYC